MKTLNKIIQMIKGFIHLGGYANTNIGFSSNENGEEIAQVKRLVGIIEEFKESRTKYSRQLTLIDFLASFKNYNDISFELLDVNSPSKWTIDALSQQGLNLFEFSLERNNLELAMKLIKSCEISKVISSFPLKTKTLENLLKSDYIVEFLKFISQHEEKLKNLILNSEKYEIPFLRLPIIFQDVENREIGILNI